MKRTYLCLLRISFLTFFHTPYPIGKNYCILEVRTQGESGEYVIMKGFKNIVDGDLCVQKQAKQRPNIEAFKKYYYLYIK